MHSSTVAASPAYSPPPDQGEVPPASPAPDQKPPSRQTPRVALIALVVMVVVAAIFFFAFRGKTASSPKTAVPSTTALHAEQMLRLKGTTEAVHMRSILAPVLSGQYVATLTVTKLVPAGTRVKQGDLIAEFDSQSQLRDLIDKQADYDKLVSQVTDQQAKENAARTKDETEIKQAEDSLDKAQLEMQKVAILSRIDAEKAQEDLEEAQTTLAQLRETFALKRKAGQAAIRTLEIQRDRTQQIMMHARADAALMEIRAPIDGIVVLNPIWKQGQMGDVQEGDQIRPGNSFMQVVDPSAMQVRVLANQEDFLSLHVGQSAHVRLDAYPDMVFSGKLEEMAPIGRNGDFSSQLRTFTVIFSVTGQDPKMMPDLSAAVDVYVSQQNNATEAGQ